MDGQLSNKVKASARYNWLSLFDHFGVVSGAMRAKKNVPCPFGCEGPRKFRITDHRGEGRWICADCGSGDGIEFLMRRRGWDFCVAIDEIGKALDVMPPAVAPLPKHSAMISDKCNRLWSNALPIVAGDPVALFLDSRGLRLAAYPARLRYHRGLAFREDDGSVTYHPGMLAMVKNAAGEFTLHRTFLTTDGCKARGEASRKLMANGGLPDGAYVALDYIHDVLGIAEGIETALAANELFGVKCWSAICASNLLKFNPPFGLRRLIIFGDNDASFVGQATAYELAHRLRRERPDLEILVRIPDVAGQDWNDVLVFRGLPIAA